MSDSNPSPREICEDYAGHEWAPAGGGLLICMRCESERWQDETEAPGSDGHDHACCPPDECCGGPCAAHPHWELTT